jgi:hypothetical protein
VRAGNSDASGKPEEEGGVALLEAKVVTVVDKRSSGRWFK